MKLRVTRDGAIIAAALLWGTFEIVLGGARAQVLTLVSTILLAPVALAFDAHRRQQRDKDDPS